MQITIKTLFLSVKQVGRLVNTHSTYIEGLMKAMKMLKNDEYINTITPGILKKVKGHKDNLIIKVTREIKGGYKLIARKGKSGQELYILTAYKKEDLEKKINESIIKSQ